MSKEITKAYILQEMQDKFKMRELVPEKFSFSETVVPIYNIEPHLSTWEVVRATVSITSATTFVFFTVPSNERWLLRGYTVIYGMTGAIKGTGLLATHRPGAADFIYLDMVKGQEVSYLVNLPVPVLLESDTLLKYLIDTYVSTQDLTIHADVLKEEIR